MSPAKPRHLQSRPFKGGDFQQTVAVTDPLFLYTPDVICPVCQELLRLCLDLQKGQSSLVPQSFFTTFEYIDVLCSATLGCHMCSLFCSAARWDSRGTDYALKQASCPLSVREGVFGLRVRYEVLPSSRTSALFMLRICMTDGKTWTVEGTDTLHVYPQHQTEVENWESLPADLSHTSLGRSTGDLETTTLARTWLEKCRREGKEHEACRETDEETRTTRPVRFLDLEGGIKLVDSTETGGEDYVTLSHCWGKAQLKCLLKSNKVQFQQGNINELPKTFLEAIQVTRALGYRYLWIDSLCIIQDSKEDKDDQLDLMGSFYANSAFTIAALKSSGSREGCFTGERNPLGRRALKHSGLGISVWPASSRSMWETEVGPTGSGASPLHTRAWVVQERYSSPRTLLYGKNGIYWECRSAQASETHYRLVEKDDKENKKTWLHRFLSFNPDQGKDKDKASGQEKEKDEAKAFDKEEKFEEEYWMKHWKGLLNAYSSCELSFDGDKINAVKGLVSLVEKRSRHGYRCIVGLWNYDLPRMALWSRSPGSAKSGRLKNEFPTWSWASVAGTCTYMLASGKLERSADISIEEQATPAAMVVRSWLRRVRPDYGISSMDDFLLGTENDNTVDDDYALVLDPEDPRMKEKGRGSNLDVEPYSWYPDCEKPGVETPMYLVEIQRYLVVESLGIRVSWCLVVTPKVGGAGEYQRVGLCLVRYEDPQDYPFTDDESAREDIRIV